MSLVIWKNCASEAEALLQTMTMNKLFPSITLKIIWYVGGQRYVLGQDVAK